MADSATVAPTWTHCWLLALSLCLLCAPELSAQDSAPVQSRSAVNVPSGLAALAIPAGEPGEDSRWTRPDDETVDLPRIRLEFWGRVSTYDLVRVKKGPAYNAGRIHLRRDTRLPRTPALGWRVVADVRFAEDWTVGGQLHALSLEGNRRRLHYRGIRLQGRYLEPLPARTRIETWLAEVFLRYVIRDNSRLRFQVGLGVTWVSLRLRISTRQNRADGRVSDVLGPSFGYLIAIELIPPLVVFAESCTALLSPARFPSFVSDLRLGLRLPLGGGFELAWALTFTTAWIEDYRDLWGGDKPHSSHRWRRANWGTTAGEFGLVWRF
ncbi:MAG TPA: hypothetical protein DEA08_16630 [Planctomycetes bacterium]|nr:hypothetical protein [Planctomycetota bacterium]